MGALGLIFKRTITVLVVTIIGCNFCSGQVYTSVYSVEQLSKEEARLHRALTTYIENAEKNQTNVSDDVKMFLENVSKLRCKYKEDRKWAEHPINSYHVIKRIVIDWADIYSNIFCEECEITYAAIDLNISLAIAKKELSQWPTVQDVEGAIASIIRLWEVYNLNISDIFSGKIADYQGEPLNTSDVMRIARHLDNRLMYYEEIVWLEALQARRSKHSMHESNPAKATVSINRALAGAYYKYGMPWESVKIIEAILDPDNKGLMNNYRFYKERAADVPLNKRKKTLRKRKRGDKIMRAYEALCRGNLKTPKQLSRLKCFLKKLNNAYLPVKQEIINKRPRIVMYHDVITPIETEFLRKHGADNFERSLTYTDITSNTKEEEYRVSQTGWLKDTDFAELLNISKKIATITGLDTTFRDVYSSVERYQVVNYGVGGMNSPHTDNLYHPITREKLEDAEEVKYSGERLATWMYYLNDVEQGGATVFPIAKARATVTKGSALFWYNILPNGKMDHRTLHAGCPVLIGSKWVTSKWIRQHGNVFRVKCSATDKMVFQEN